MARAVRKAGQVRRRDLCGAAPLIEPAEGIQANELRLGLGDRPGRDLRGPGERRLGVAGAQVGSGRVVRVVGRQARVLAVKRLEHRRGLGPLRLIGLRQRGQVTGRGPLLGRRRHARGGLQKTGLRRRPALLAVVDRRFPRQRPLKEGLEPPRLERDRFRLPRRLAPLRALTRLSRLLGFLGFLRRLRLLDLLDRLGLVGLFGLVGCLGLFGSRRRGLGLLFIGIRVRGRSRRAPASGGHGGEADDDRRR